MLRPNGSKIFGYANKNGYLNVSIAGKSVRVNIFVCETFHGPCPEGMEAAHEDNNPGNCSATNVRWKTHLDNIHDKWRHGTMLKGFNHPSSLLTKEAVTEIRKRYRGRGITMQQLADEYGVVIGAIHKILNDKSYFVDNDQLDINEKFSRGKGERHACAKLTDDIVRFIRSNHRGYTYAQLADRYGVRTCTISNVINRKTWRHI